MCCGLDSAKEETEAYEAPFLARGIAILVFDGPGGGSFVLAPGADGWTVDEGSETGAPTVHTTVHDFVAWGTKRSDWRDVVTGDTDNADLATVLDAINII